eukprot:4926536-Alexandrium_andersonii.AAC.1
MSGHALLPSLQTMPCPAAHNFSSLTPSERPAGAGSPLRRQEFTFGSATSMRTHMSSLRSG